MAKNSSGSGKKHADELFRCSFCGRSELETRSMIVQDNACICDECIRACSDIIAQDNALSSESGEKLLSPQEIKEKLDEYEIRQVDGIIILLPKKFWKLD